MTIYVSSVSGNDKWSGLLPQPNAAHTDGPLATFDRARRAVQAAKKNSPSAITVQFRNGVYQLPALGTYYRVAKTVYSPTKNATCAVPVGPNGSGPYECFDRFDYDPNDPIADTWKNLEPAPQNPCGQPAGNPALRGDVELLLFEQFSTTKLRINCVDPVKHRVYLTGATPISQNHASEEGFIQGNRYLVENVQNALTEPGQWFLDRATTPWTLTYLTQSGENPNVDEVVVPQIPQLVTAHDLQSVTFRGLTFEYDNYTVPAAGHPSSEMEMDVTLALSFQNSQHITLDGLVVRHASGGGIDFISCLKASVSPAWCQVFEANPVTAGNVIENSAVYDVGALGIRIGDQGAANNTISFNHVYNLLQGIMNDGGSIRIEAGNQAFTASGNKILNNKIHDTSDASAIDANGYGGDGIYMDNQTGLVDVENNLVYRVSGNAIEAPQGPARKNEANTIKNNILAFARQALVSVNKPYQSGAPYIPNQVFVVTNNLMVFDRSRASNPPFDALGGCTYSGGVGNSAAFPYTAFQLFESNLYWRTDAQFATDDQAFHVQPNVSPTQTGNYPCSRDSSQWLFYSFADWQTIFGEDAQSVVRDPQFVNPVYPVDDFTLQAGSPGVGFVPFNPKLAGRTAPVLRPPAVAPTFPTALFDPRTDF